MQTRIVNVRDLPWRTYLGRNQLAQGTNVRVLRLVYSAWLVIFAIKLVGSAWDVGWHFRFLRDDLAPPHIINTFGMMCGIGLLVMQYWTGLAAERWGSWLVQAGAAIFLVAIPLDLINHRLFGLDITAWSPTHALLYLGTALMIVGVLRSWLRLATPGRWRTGVGLGLYAFLLEDVLFPLGHQEYGTLALDAYQHGRSTADAELIAAGGQNITAFALGAIPLWLYPLWLIIGSTLVLVAGRSVLRWRWAATSVAALYLASRLLGYGLLRVANFPPSFIPAMLLGGGLVVDLAFHYRTVFGRTVWLRPVATSIALLAVYYGSVALIQRTILVPAFPLAAAPVIGVLLVGVLVGVEWLETMGQRTVSRVV